MKYLWSIFHIGVAFAIRILGSFSLLALTLITSRNTSIEDAGVFFQILSLIIPISTIARYGADTTLIKIIKNEKKSRFAIYLYGFLARKTLSLSFFISSAIFLSIFFTKIILGNYVQSDMYYVSIIPLSMLTAIINLRAIAIQAIERINLSILLKNVLPYLITVIILGIFLITNIKFNLILILLSFIVSNWILLIFHSSTFSEYKSLTISENKEIVSKRYASLIFYFSLILMFQQWVSIAISSYFLCPSDLAYLNILSRISNTLAIVLVAINSVYIQKFAQEINNRCYEKLIVLLNRSTKIAVTAGIILCVSYFWFSYDILKLFGNEYVKSQDLLKIFILGQFVNLATGPVIQVIMMLDDIKGFFILSLKFTAVLTFISILLIYNFGLQGAVYSLLLFNVIKNVVNYFWLRRRLKYLVAHNSILSL